MVVVVVGSVNSLLVFHNKLNTKNNMNAYLAHTHSHKPFLGYTQTQTDRHTHASKQQTDHAWYKFLRLNFTTTFVLRICFCFF